MQKEKAVIFGAAGTGRKIYAKIKDRADVVCFSENNPEYWGTDVDGVPVVPPADILTMDYDTVYIGSMVGLTAITEQLIGMGVPAYRIVKDLPYVQITSRILFLERFASMVYARGLQGCVAEAGVYRGEFAKEINRCFPDRKLYLFDTFSGFDARDFAMEKEASMTKADYLKDTSESLVLEKMPHRENCVVRKGYFPDSAAGLEERFVFVSLDIDLYKPTCEGLAYFYPRMVKGGVIAVHDYFSQAYPNVKTAIDDFAANHGVSLSLCPIGDDLSVVVIK